ncbi:unnamed protein product [Rotaria magnacalcarata]|uniref:Hypoxia up-regulated protein 1 n=3 Tax=Rotaria magnacalcarata TaxID=392030 RepID=A0A8S2MKP8_9BILA|nr:unnamed protein product [Rotaria magnacalcarata]
MTPPCCCLIVCVSIIALFLLGGLFAAIIISATGSTTNTNTMKTNVTTIIANTTTTSVISTTTTSTTSATVTTTSVTSTTTSATTTTITTTSTTSGKISYSAEIQQVLLFGGSTRIPRVQNELVKSLGGIELGKRLNTDEAAAMGGVYQAAALSKGYRVKKFIAKDANQYPINVQFERHADPTAENSEPKLIDRTLFQRNNLYPNRKVMTFNRHTDDFSFDVRYGDLSFLSDTDKRSLGKTDLLRINVSGARKAYEKHQDTSESKGVKAHFQLDDNSLLVLDRVEFVFERKETEAERTNATKDEDESTLSKLGSKISSFFSSSGASSSENDTNNTTNSTEETVPTNTTETTNDEQTAKPVDEKEGANATDNTTTTTTTTTAPPLKTITIREPLEFTVEILDYADPTLEARANSVKKLTALDTHDRELLALSTAKNNLESFIYDMRDKLEHDSNYKKATTPEEQTKINEKLSETDAWLWDDGINADVKTLKSKLDELKLLTKLLVLRVREVDLRPQKIQELKDTPELRVGRDGTKKIVPCDRSKHFVPWDGLEI